MSDTIYVIQWRKTPRHKWRFHDCYGTDRLYAYQEMRRTQKFKAGWFQVIPYVPKVSILQSAELAAKKSNGKHDGRVAIFRSACLPEDEGLDEFIMTVRNKAEARKWISQQRGYFTASDYYIKE